jgi:hypothetical protein
LAVDMACLECGYFPGEYLLFKFCFGNWARAEEKRARLGLGLELVCWFRQGTMFQGGKGNHSPRCTVFRFFGLS